MIDENYIVYLRLKPIDNFFKECLFKNLEKDKQLLCSILKDVLDDKIKKYILIFNDHPRAV